MSAIRNDSSIVISHLTDIEGNIAYLERWTNRSPYLQFIDGRLLFREPNCKFVYGGDSCDKGPGDIRLGQALVAFKADSPTNVTLIAGNRDIKCRRFTYELTTLIQQRLLHGASAYWNQKSSPRQYILLKMQTEGKSAASVTDIKKYVMSQDLETCQTIYLKWMLNETMGCGSFNNKPTTFEYRRMELAVLSRQPLVQISDEQVTRSFIDSVCPSGFLARYLQQAQLGHIIGETLFVHGAITLENMGYVPGMSDSDARITNAREWIEQLNDWYAGQIRDWLECPVEDELHAPGHKPLDKYVVFNPKSIVTSNWYRDNTFAPIHKKVVTFLNNAGIYRVISGHQPCSDFPLIIRNPDLEVIVGDTGYSDPSALTDNRGMALHNLTIRERDTERYVSIDAIRRDGSSMIVNLPSHLNVQQGKDTLIGHFTPDGRLIRPANALQLFASQLDGFRIIDSPFNPN